ncbi:MAG: thiamine-phosphate kinase [Gemmatimonadaceae bacterium]
MAKSSRLYTWCPLSPDLSRQSNGIPLREGVEFDFVRRMLARWGPIAEGIGDDAAILAAVSDRALIASTDVSVENVHFRRGWLEPREIGYRATASALSDLAAIAATPLGILVALTLPELWRAHIDEIADGIGDAAQNSCARIVGGDLSEGRDLSLAITVLGTAEHPLRRDGAHPGDRVYVTGRLGGPLAAINALVEGRAPAAEHRERFAHPVPRIREARWLVAHGASAGIDISDGLAADLGQIAAASEACVALSLDRVPTMPGISASDAAGSGEEYELAVTSRDALDTRAFIEEFGIPLTEVGTVEAGRPIVRVFDRGAPVPTPSGYLHFRESAE